MPLGTLTYTGSIGPGSALTTKSFTRVRSLDFDLENNVLEVTQAFDNPQGNTITQLSLAAATTVTDTITAGVHAVVVS